MNTAFLIVTVLFMLVSLAMVLIILVQRPSGGGLAGAFGGAGGSGADTVFGGRVGDALTWATVGAFTLYLGFAIALNLLDNVQPSTTTVNSSSSLQAPAGASTTQPVIGDIPDDLQEIDFGGLGDPDPTTAEIPAADNSDDSSDDESDSIPDDSTSEDSPDGDN